jgi:purine-nucleoside phosphorylase
VSGFAAGVAIVFGSGLALVPDGLVVEEEVAYGDLGWPVTHVAGHHNRMLVARRDAPGEQQQVLLLHGRAHRSEGWSDDELERPVVDLALWGVDRLVLTNACGGLSERAVPGGAVVVEEVVDLQAPPDAEPPRLAATASGRAAVCAQALSPWLHAQVGRYVAVPGPQYETPAEVRWLAQYGDVVGMSTAPEVRAATKSGQSLVVVALVVNAAGAAFCHADVVAAGGRLTAGLRKALLPMIDAAWPAEENGE